MPDVGLFTAAEPLPSKAKVIIEIEGLPVYTETYDVDTLAKKLREDAATALECWSRRLQCVVNCRARPGFSSCVTRCLIDGHACDCGHDATQSARNP